MTTTAMKSFAVDTSAGLNISPLEKMAVKGGLPTYATLSDSIGSMFKSIAGLPVSLEIKAGTNNLKIAEPLDTPQKGNYCDCSKEI